MAEPVVLYTRMLPGGGQVTIESRPAGASRVEAKIRVERRGDPQRRSGHSPPVIVERTGDEEDALLRELFEIATDNVAIARHLIAWQAGR